MDEKVVIGVFDQKIGARLERERQQTVRGLWALKTHEGICKATKSQPKEKHEDKKLELVEEADLAEKSKDVEIAKHSCYRFTKLSKLKMLCVRREKKKFETFLNQYKKWKFYTSMIKLKTIFLSQEWHRTCHLKERMLIRENAHLENILRVRWEYNVDEIIPADSVVFDKIMKYKRDRRREAKLRKQRMIQIIYKITREMSNGIRLLKRPQTSNKQVKRKSITSILEKFGEESFEEVSSEKTESNEEELKIQSKILVEDLATVAKKEDKISKIERNLVNDTTSNDKIKEAKHKSVSKEPLKAENDIEAKEEASLNGIDTFTVTRVSKSSIEEIFPMDTCFFANPNVVGFEDFEVDKKYTRKLAIINKTSRWAYLRFNKVYADVWESGVIEIDTMDAAKVKPGLHVTVTVKFSPVNDEKVTADISFLTLKPDDTKTFHEFRVRVLCTPKNPVPILDPPEIRFPTAPIWRFDDSKISEKTLVVLNEGEKPFSFTIGERNHRKDYFVWHFDEADAQSVKSSTSCISETGNEEHSMENDTVNMLDTPRKMFRIEVPPRFKCRLRIIFRPKYVGLHHEVVKLCFFSDDRMLGTQNVPIWAEVTGSQINLDPPCIDLGVAIVDTDVCQQTFNIVNIGRSSIEVAIKTPKRLGNRVIVYPRSTILQPETVSAVSVKLIPESDFLDLSKRFYDRTSSILEFPIQVQPVTQDAEKPPPLLLKVIANLITCHGLILEPVSIDLDLVHTHESVYAELTLTNDCLSVQDYAFPNLPPSIQIQPNHGFGTILAGETIKLHLIYSACVTDIPGNEIAANGLAGERRFQVEVVTLTELAGKNQKKLSELKNLYEMQMKAPRNRGIPPKVSLYPRLPETMPTNEEGVDLNDISNFEDSNFLLNEEDTEEVELEKVREFQRDKRKKKNVVTVVVDIVDTYCEISEPIIEFPATPCGSFSTASVDLRGFNMASYPHCTCGTLKNQEKEFTARYEFQCSSDHIQVVPQRGFLCSREFVKINFIFKPRLHENAILEESQKLRAETEMREKEKQEKSEATHKSRKGRPKRSKSPKRKTVKAANEKDAISEMDKLAGEISLLETFESHISIILVTCTINMETKDGMNSREHLFVKLICPVTRPEILILNEDRDMAFGPTPIGTASRKLLLVKNICNRNVKVDVSLLDPFGPFYVAPGKTIETGSILKLPVTYRPSGDNEAEELFEVSEAKTRTRWLMKASGRGVVPSYVLKPRFKAARFDVTDDRPVELKMSIQNTGNCPLTFQLQVIDVLEGDMPGTQEESQEKSSKKEKKRKKGKSDGGSRGKSPRKPELADTLRENEELAIFGGALKPSPNRDYFSFRNFDENMQISVQEGKKVDFSIRFQRWSKEEISGKKEAETPRKGRKTRDRSQKSEKSIKSEQSAKREKSVKREKKADLKKTNYCHAAVLQLMLGSSLLVQDVIMICSIK